MPTKKIIDEVGNVVATLTQRGQGNNHNAQAIIKVFPEGLFTNGRLEIAVGGGDHPDIHRDRLFAAQPLQGFFLEDPHQLDLGSKGHVPDFVEEDSAVMGLLEAADALFAGAP